MQNGQQIGETAGRIWKILGQKQRLPLSRLSQEAKCDSDLTLLGCGWLAREGKINLDHEGKSVVASLTEQERETYKRLNGDNGHAD